MSVQLRQSPVEYRPHEDRLKLLADGVAQEVGKKLPVLNELSRQYAIAQTQISKGNAMQAEGKAMQAKGNAMQAKGNAMQAEGNAMQAEGNAMQVEGRAMQEKARKGIAVADAKIAAAYKEAQEAMIRMFYKIFNGNSKTVPTSEELAALFDKYLADRCVTLEEPGNGEMFARINNMTGVINYLKDHPTIGTCDFRAYKTEIRDIVTLAEFLKNSTIRAVAFKSGIAEADKENLAQAVAARNGSLKVQYFA